MTPAQIINTLLSGQDLTRDAMLALTRSIMSGEYTPVQVAGILVALRAKGETVTEIAAAAEVMRELAVKVPVSRPENLVDTCGTGGDGAHTFNISTTSALVAAAAGVRVAKHGGRSVSSTCGSADVLEALGVNVSLPPEKVGAAIDSLGIGFMFAPNHHTAMKYAAPVRRELGVRTLFNLLGPLTNPAGARRQVIGVFAPHFVRPVAEALQTLGAEHVLVVHGDDSLDEISLATPTLVAELAQGRVNEYRIAPADFGFTACATDALAVSSLEEAREKLQGVLAGTPGPARDVVLLNAAAAIYVGGVAGTLGEGVALAAKAIDCGGARAKLEALAAFGQGG